MTRTAPPGAPVSPSGATRRRSLAVSGSLLVALLAFGMPWVTVHCNGATADLTGAQLAFRENRVGDDTVGPEVLLVLAVALVLLGLVGVLAGGRLWRRVRIAADSLALIALWLDDAGWSIRSYETLPGLWLFVAALLGALAADLSNWGPDPANAALRRRARWLLGMDAVVVLSFFGAPWFLGYSGFDSWEPAPDGIDADRFLIWLPVLGVLCAALAASATRRRLQVHLALAVLGLLILLLVLSPGGWLGPQDAGIGFWTAAVLLALSALTTGVLLHRSRAHDVPPPPTR